VLGRALVPLLAEAGYQPVVLSRSAPTASSPARTVAWDGRTLGPWSEMLDGAEAIINLAGSPAVIRHTPRARAEILRSRVESVRVLGEALGRCSRPPRVWLQASGVGYYGDGGDRALDEGAPAGGTFLAGVCRQWESGFEVAAQGMVRTVVLRIGVALGRGGGAYPPLRRLACWGLGGAIGNGRQYMSWVHTSDVLKAVVWALQTGTAAGAFNLTAPAPVTNGDLMRTLRRQLRRPWSPPVPAFALRAASIVTGIEPSLLLESQRIIPRRLLEGGFRFEFPDLAAAINDLERR
jgi:uncharacterized protein (TIGR01777 family)